ncbi:MAG: DUF445 family protein [Leptospiraceae bacterium]|nr:DUF445 family protein [Leptospiraceae bacterium]
MPLTYGFVGWFTNWVALKMTFYPLDFWGIPPFLGWQGIIPRKAQKMADKAVDVITERLIKIEEIFDKVDPKQVEKELKPLLNQMTEDITKDIVDDLNPQLWGLLPDQVKKEIVKSSQAQTPKTIRNIISDIRANIYHVFDLKGLVLKSMTGKNVVLTVDMFQKVGAPEFRFIERSGLYFGFLLGSIQMGIWYLYPEWWTLPIQGVIVGYLTNYLALRMIFRPLHPKKFGPFTYHGLFLKRQAEVSKQYAELVAQNILTPRKILEQVLYGRATEEIFALIRQSVARAVDHTANVAKPIMSITMGSEKYDMLRDYAVAKMTGLIPASAQRLEKYVGEAMDIERTMYERMKALEPDEFEKILRTAFQEDEFILILVGAVLGAAVGLGQGLFMIW